MTLRLSVLALLLPVSAFAADRCVLSDPALTVQSYHVDAKRERIVTYWKNKDGKAWESIRNLLNDIDSNGRVQMVMNGGIYDKSYAPLGLYIENGRKRVPLNRASGGGNFFIRPGGVFYLKGQKAAIVSLDQFTSSKGVDYAVQSGPLLIQNGNINPRLLASASSRKIRNAVGITSQGQVVFMLSAGATNFFDFACYAKSKLAIRQMLYLDGTISAMYQKGGSIPWQYHPFVSMIAVEAQPGDR